jgi:outer membrane lipoprotein-sorting protein
MLNSKLILILLLTLPMALATTATAEDAAAIMEKSHLAYYYAADDGISEVTMRITSKRGKERTKEFVMLRLDEEEGGKQKYYTYFRKPSDIARLTFIVHKIPDGNDQRWIYVPSVDLVKPISADDKNSSFVGSHFSYEDVSGRHWSEDKHRLLPDSTIGVEEIDGVITMTARSMENLKKGGKTLIEFSGIEYNVGLDASLFTERFLKNPPRKYIK